VLVAHAKNLVHELLLDGDVPEDPGVVDTLAGYFPEPVRAKYAAQISSHRLGREIIATRLANELIDKVGPGFIYRVEDRTGVSTDQAIRGILVVTDLLGLDELWNGLAPYPVGPTIPVRHALERALEYNASWLVRRKSSLAAVDSEAAVFREAVTRLREAKTTSPPLLDAVAPSGPRFAALADLGVSRDLLTGCHAVSQMQEALCLASAAIDSGFDIVDLEATYAGMGETLGLSWLYATIPISSADPHWVQLAKAALRDELAAITVAIATEVLATGGLAAWTREHQGALARTHSAYAGLAGSNDVDVAMLTVGVQVLRDLRHAVRARA
jgi:glutamate dehydrogenase